MLDKVLVFTAGLPGAGKSTVIKKGEFKNLPIVDPDEIKKENPLYDVNNPSTTHEWSKMQARKRQLGYLSNEESFIMDGTGTNVEKYLRWFNEAREMGYKVVVLYVKVSVSTSIKRNAQRERTVPMDVILNKADVIDQSMNILGQVADEFLIVENH